MTALPSWAEERRYEYDLGMSTSCHHCMADLIEGQFVVKDTETPNTYYCSPDCACIAEEGVEP